MHGRNEEYIVYDYSEKTKSTRRIGKKFLREFITPD